MKLSRFINEHVEQILSEWESFARTLKPAADGMSMLELRDHAEEILREIALYIDTPQNPAPQDWKPQDVAAGIPEEQSAAAIHGTLRHASKFTLLQLTAEYRALRASVLRLWLPHVADFTDDTAYEIVQFNEAIDQALAESVVTYSSRAEHTKDLFMAILGHDLRAPLSTMTMAGELLTRLGLANDQVSELGTRVSRSARLMSTMVDDLLGYTRTQMGGGIPISPHHANIKDICQAAIEDASAMYPTGQFDLEVAGELSGTFDSVRLHQLIANLLINAAQYGAKERPVSIYARGESEAVTVQVTNHGPAISEVSLQSIFRPLIQLPVGGENDVRPRTSLGLGLFVAREIAVGHGGTIDVKSNEVEGTTFTVRLPRVVQAH